MGMNEYKLPSQPVCPKESVIQGDNFRITMLTEALCASGVQPGRAYLRTVLPSQC